MNNFDMITKNKIIDYLNNGYSLTNIASISNVSRSRLHRLVKDMPEYRAIMGRSKLSIVQEKNLIEDYKNRHNCYNLSTYFYSKYI
jgi:predicted DNA-binding protein YlxM (UPF0122 family)